MCLSVLVQEYIVDGSNRTAVGNVFNFPLLQKGGAIRAEPDDYSIYGFQIYFYPFAEGGKHELQCFATASASGFDPNPINTTAVSARFTGSWVTRM